MPVWLIVLLPALAAHAVMWPVTARLHYRNFAWQEERAYRGFGQYDEPWDTETRVAALQELRVALEERAYRGFVDDSVPWDTRTRVEFSALIGFLWPLVLFGWGFYYACHGVALYTVKPSREERRRARIDYAAAEAELARVTAEIEGKIVP